MAEELYLLHPEDVHFKHDGHVVFEEVIKPGQKPKKGLKPETEVIPIVRTFLSFAERFISTHPMFNMKHGYARVSSVMRILDAIAKSKPGKWFFLREDDIKLVKDILSDPNVGVDPKSEEKVAIAALSVFEVTQFKGFFDTFFNTRTSPPTES